MADIMRFPDVKRIASAVAPRREADRVPAKSEPKRDRTSDGLRYLDDFRVGERFRSGTHAVSADQIKVFADEFDPQPFHLDESAARGTLFGGLAASGWHTAALTMKLLVTGGLPIAGGIVGRGGEVEWPRPMRPGDVLRVESEVTAVTPSRSKPDRGTVTFKVQTLNQKDEVVQAATMNLVVPRRPAAEGGENDVAGSLLRSSIAIL